MASFYKRGDYQWEAKVRRAGFPSQSQTFESKSEARNWAHKLESEMRLGTFVAPTQANQRPLSEFVDLYVRDVTPSHKGADVEALRLKALARHRFFETAICNLRPKTIATWRDERLADVMPATVVRELGLLQQVVDHAMREWDVVIANNPFKLVKRPKVANTSTARPMMYSGHGVDVTGLVWTSDAHVRSPDAVGSCRAFRAGAGGVF